MVVGKGRAYFSVDEKVQKFLTSHRGTRILLYAAPLFCFLFFYLKLSFFYLKILFTTFI